MRLLAAAALLLGCFQVAAASVTATITVSGTVQPGDASAITVAFNGFSETVKYDSTSTVNSVASAFAAMFSRDDLQAGLCASATGNVITFKLKTGTFGVATITGPSPSFHLASAGFGTVSPLPPVANAGGPYTGTTGTAVSLSGSGSSDPQGQALTYAWNFGDGSTGTGVNPAHTYAAAGIYTVTLAVTDTGGLPGTATGTAAIANAGASGPAAATNRGVVPQLVPYTMRLVAGNSSYAIGAEVGGYGGDGGPGSQATLNAPDVIAVDSVGNVYFADLGNGLIREVNAQTGVISTVAGQMPSNCTGTACYINSGCADGVLAAASPIGASVQGIAIDAYGNLYFSDAITETISVVYRGGAQVAAFIALENPAGVAKAGGVLAGYVYHVAGTVNLASCVGLKTLPAHGSSPAIPAGDGQMAYNGGGATTAATFGNAGPLGLDSAGNLYIGDGGYNNTIRVINTQSSTNTFFGVAVLPGYIASIVNCGSLTQPCPPGGGSTPETVANTGVGGPAGGAEFNALAVGQGAWMSVDAYGTIFEGNTKNAAPSINVAVAYAGGAATARLINLANAAAGTDTVGPILNAASLPPATPGDFYYLMQGITLRPSSISADAAGNLYYLDNHYGQIYRVDANAVGFPADYLAISYLTSAGLTTDLNRGPAPATAASPAFCYPASGPPSTNPTLSGYQTTDPYGNGCPASLANGIGVPHSGTGYGSTVEDASGNVYIADRTNEQIRKITVNNLFPATPVGQALNPVNLNGQQTLQVHFDQGNLPVLVGTQATNAFSIAPGIPDFSISTTESQWTNATQAGYQFGSFAGTYTLPAYGPELPACANINQNADASLDCILNVIFSPTAPGLRQSTLMVTTANGSVYNVGLSGVGTGGQLAIDGGAQNTIPIAGLGNTGQVAVTSAGTVYVADPANNRVVVLPAGGTQTTVGTGLKAPMGVAVDASGNVYIADTGNSRVVEVVQATGAQVVMGGILAAGTPAYAGYTFNAPQGLAVDLYGNVYVADTGNAKVVEIPSNPVLGGATPLLQYSGAPTLAHPVAVALDTKGNVYVADSGYDAILTIPAGGGDLQNLPGAALPILRGGPPSGLAVDAAGNIYISDAGNNQVYEYPSGPLLSLTLPINFTGLALNGVAGVGGSLALDPNGNLYLADAANSRVLFMNRSNPTVPCGVAPQNPASPVTCGGAPLTSTARILTVTNIGNAPVALTSPFTSVTSTAPAGNTAFTVTNNCSGTLLPGQYCTISPGFAPAAAGLQSETVSINGSTAQSVTITGTGE